VLRKKFDASRPTCQLIDIYGADEMFCTGTMGELAGVVRIDNRQIGDGNVGPMTKR
jgi:branched-chain amino acid aminotransferase